MRHLAPAAALALSLAALSIASLATAATGGGGAELTVLVDGAPRPEYPSRGTLYVEALRGRDYALLIRNPFPYRVAVALAVDGLNTIDARHTDAWKARKWVLEPYGSAVIEGWQVTDSRARRFTFTGERQSYGAFLGKTQDLGVIEAVFFREKARHLEPHLSYDTPFREDRDSSGRGVPPAGEREKRAEAAPKAAGSAAAPSPQLSDEYAATGMGEGTRHDVTRVDVDLERTAVASIRLRYEFRTQLVKLGVLPPERGRAPIDRREHARGFDGYCPEPGR